MAKSRIYPPANRTAQWWESKYDRGTFPTIEKLLLHTTETAGWPAYGGGASAPTLTYNPWLSSGRWRQHNYLNTSARALRDPSGTAVRENRDNVVQVEIICYCDPNLYKKYGHGVNNLPAHAYEELGAFLAFLHTEWGVPIVRAPKWSTFPPPDSIRMSSSTYDAFRGVLGHQHASGNTHGDPGMTNAQVDRIIAVAKRLTAVKPPAATSEGDEMTFEQFKNYLSLLYGPTGTEGVWYAKQMAALEAILANLAEIKATLARIEDDTDDGSAAHAQVMAQLAEIEAMVVPPLPDPKA